MDYKNLVLRHKFLQFIKLGDMEEFSVLGVGSTDLSMEYSAESNEYKWVTQKSGKTITTGYTVTSSVEQFVYADDPVFKKVDELRRKLATGSEATGELINAFAYEAEGDMPTSTPAEKWNVSIEFAMYGDGSEDPLKIGYTIHYNGTPQPGTATIDYDTNSATFAEKVGE